MFWHGLLAIVSVAVTLLLAIVCYRFVEKVFIELGKDLAEYIGRSFPRPFQVPATEE
jgi:peptidoglycan/LPS O-acetylase OafA/YrhL